MRRRADVVEQHQFVDGSLASIIKRAISLSSLHSSWIRVPLSGGRVFRRGIVPTRFGFVRVSSWPTATTYDFIVDGTSYTRRDTYGITEDRETRNLAIRAGLFARRAVELHSEFISKGGVR